MNTTIFSAHNFEKEILTRANNNKHDLNLVELALTRDTASLAKGSEAIAIFSNDDASEDVLVKLKDAGIKFIALRSAGFNHVNLAKAKELGIRVARVPAYSPYAIAEHAITLMLALNRKLIKANNRVHDLNFSLDGLTGFDMNGKTVGIIGVGKIGAVLVKILHGFGCNIIAVDLSENEDLKQRFGLQYVNFDTLYKDSDIISLHVPLTPETRYLINKDSIAKMKKGVMLVNTGRGGLVNTKDIIAALKTGQIGYLGLDVYEEEAALFFEDHSDDILQDDIISRLLSFKNVLITSHQAFLTETALQNISDTTVYNLDCFASGSVCENEI